MKLMTITLQEFLIERALPIACESAQVQASISMSFNASSISK